VQHLSRRDLRAALDFLAYVGEAGDLDDFAARLVFRLDAVIPCHAAATTRSICAGSGFAG
jgi:hypothetical protein